MSVSIEWSISVASQIIAQIQLEYNYLTNELSPITTNNERVDSVSPSSLKKRQNEFLVLMMLDIEDLILAERSFKFYLEQLLEDLRFLSILNEELLRSQAEMKQQDYYLIFMLQEKLLERILSEINALIKKLEMEKRKLDELIVHYNRSIDVDVVKEGFNEFVQALLSESDLDENDRREFSIGSKMISVSVNDILSIYRGVHEVYADRARGGQDMDQSVIHNALENGISNLFIRKIESEKTIVTPEEKNLIGSKADTICNIFSSVEKRIHADVENITINQLRIHELKDKKGKIDDLANILRTVARDIQTGRLSKNDAVSNLNALSENAVLSFSSIFQSNAVAKPLIEAKPYERILFPRTESLSESLKASSNFASSYSSHLRSILPNSHKKRQAPVQSSMGSESSHEEPKKGVARPKANVDHKQDDNVKVGNDAGDKNIWRSMLKKK